MSSSASTSSVTTASTSSATSAAADESFPTERMQFCASLSCDIIPRPDLVSKGFATARTVADDQFADSTGMCILSEADFTRIVCRYLEATYEKNKDAPPVDPSILTDHSGVAQMRFLRFETTQPEALPPISAYAGRLLGYSCSSPTAVIMALAYLDWLRRKPAYFPVTWRTVHRAFGAALRISNKLADDDCWNNAEWARLTGVCLEEVNGLELGMLSLLRVHLYLRPVLFTQFFHHFITKSPFLVPVVTASTTGSRLSAWLRVFIPRPLSDSCRKEDRDGDTIMVQKSVVA